MEAGEPEEEDQPDPAEEETEDEEQGEQPSPDREVAEVGQALKAEPPKPEPPEPEPPDPSTEGYNNMESSILNGRAWNKLDYDERGTAQVDLFFAGFEKALRSVKPSRLQAMAQAAGLTLSCKRDELAPHITSCAQSSTTVLKQFHHLAKEYVWNNNWPYRAKTLMFVADGSMEGAVAEAEAKRAEGVA